MFSALFNGFNKQISIAARDPSSNSIIALAHALDGRFVNVDARDDSSYTPLMWAVHNGQLNKIILLLKHNANPYLTLENTNNLLHIAIRGERWDVYSYLAQRLPKLLHLTGEEGKTPDEIMTIYRQLRTRLALERNILSAVKDLENENIEDLADALDNTDVNVNVRDVFDLCSDSSSFLYTPLMWAVQLNQLDKVKLLLKYKADPYLKTKEGNTVLHIAAREGHLSIYHYLAEQFPMLRYEQGEKKRTPDQEAESCHQVEIMNHNQTHFFNAFFSSVKARVDPELALMVASFVQDPESMENLSLINKAWYELLKTSVLKNEVERHVRSFLAKNLRKATWQQITDHYYPVQQEAKKQSKAPQGYEDVDEFLLMKQFIRKAATFYVIDNQSVELLSYEKPWEPERRNEKPFRDEYYLGSWSREDILCASQRFFQRELRNHCLIKTYQSLQEVFDAEGELNKYHNTFEFWRSLRTSSNPIYEVTINTALALSLLKNSEKQVKLDCDAIVSVKRCYLSNMFFEHHSIKPFSFSLKSIKTRHEKEAASLKLRGG